MKSHYNHNLHTNNNMTNNYNYKNMAKSDSSKYNNMPDLIDSYNIIQKKLDLFCCTSAESSTSSQMHLQPSNNYGTLKLENPEASFGRNISAHNKKKGATVLHSENDNCEGKKCGMEEGLVCSMCGDVGIAELLFLCSKCSHRPQHIYCSRSYPDMGVEASICNWCLHEEDSLASSVVKASTLLNDANARTKASKVNNANARANASVTRPIKELMKYPAAHVNAAPQDEVSVKKGHGKAFEYLLLIAAQSLPQVNSEASGEIRQVIETDMKQANHTASMLNITNPKMGSSDNKANCDLDKKLNMGSADNQANINSSRRLIKELDSKQLHSNLNIKLDDKVDVGVFGGNIPKRLRCSKGINASLKCRKKGLQLSPSRPNYRRYKLLADVVC